MPKHRSSCAGNTIWGAARARAGRAGAAWQGKSRSHIVLSKGRPNTSSGQFSQKVGSVVEYGHRRLSGWPEDGICQKRRRHEGAQFALKQSAGPDQCSRADGAMGAWQATIRKHVIHVLVHRRPVQKSLDIIGGWCRAGRGRPQICDETRRPALCTDPERTGPSRVLCRHRSAQAGQGARGQAQGRKMPFVFRDMIIRSFPKIFRQDFSDRFWFER
jgi:hypothetical protein